MPAVYGSEPTEFLGGCRVSCLAKLQGYRSAEESAAAACL